MPRPRLTLARMMIVVGIVAVEVAAARALDHREPELTLGLAVMGPVAQLALLGIALSRGRARAFWSGFAALGLVAMASFAWAVLDEDSPPFDAWWWYTDKAEHVAYTTFDTPLLIATHPSGTAVNLTAALWSLPQGVAALLGGLAAYFLVLVGGLARTRRPTSRPAHADRVPNIPGTFCDSAPSAQR